MSTSDSSRVYRFSDIRDSRIFVTVSVGGPAGSAIQDRLMERIQGVLDQQVPGSFPRDRPDNTVERGYIMNSAEAEHSMRQNSTGEHSPPPYEEDPSASHGRPTQSSPDVVMSSPPEDFYQQPAPPDSQAYRPDDVVTKLESQVAELATENGELKQSLQNMANERADLITKLGKTTQERDDFSRQRQANLLKIRKLNDMIIKNSQNSDEPLDQDILQEMFKVRNMATEVIKTFYPGEAKIRLDIARGFDDFYAHFYEHRMASDKNPERRRRLLISLLFGELQLAFFGPNARRFGVPKEMERELQHFEKQIEASNKVDTEDALEWRRSTVSYAGRLNFSTSETANKCANRMFAILEPMVLQGLDKHGNPDKKQLASLEHALSELCGAALKLALRFRSSRTKYEFKAYQDNTSLAVCDEELIRKIDADGPVSRPLDPNKLQIFCTLFGALVKTRPSVSGEPGETVVLEKGHIIVHEPQLRGKPQ